MKDFLFALFIIFILFVAYIRGHIVGYETGYATGYGEEYVEVTVMGKEKFVHKAEVHATLKRMSLTTWCDIWYNTSPSEGWGKDYEIETGEYIPVQK